MFLTILQIFSAVWPKNSGARIKNCYLLKKGGIVKVFCDELSNERNLFCYSNAMRATLLFASVMTCNFFCLCNGDNVTDNTIFFLCKNDEETVT